MNRTRHALASTVLLGAMALGLSSCGQDTPAICDDVGQLRSSVTHLKDIQIDQAMANPSVATLTALRPQVTALGTALGNLTDAVSSTC